MIVAVAGASTGVGGADRVGWNGPATRGPVSRQSR
jgi:hypothetical protein